MTTTSTTSMSTSKIVLTGPPGAGKSTWAKSLGCAVFDDDIHWKMRVRAAELSEYDWVFVCYAPEAETKDFYVKRLQPTHLITIMPDFWVCVDQMEQRSGKKGQLHKWDQHWYKNWSRHPMEEIYESASAIRIELLDR